jgi:hypothetical protein
MMETLNMTMTRKEFMGTLLTGVATLTVVEACGNSSPPPPGNPPGASCDNGTAADIADNHGHVLDVSKEDVKAGADKTYDIMGTAGHTHSVTITAADFARLAANTSIREISTIGANHSHVVAVSCV